MAERRSSIRRRLRLTIVVTVCIFALLATVVAYEMANQAEDRVLAQMLINYAEGHHPGDHFSIISAEQADPVLVEDLSRDPGPVEVYLSDGREFMACWPDRRGPIYLFDVASMESMELSKGGGYRFGLTLPALAGFGLLLVLVPAMILVERLLRPLGRLVDGIAALRPGERIRIAGDLRQRPDEVGLLSEALSDLLERVDGFVERERRFSRDASHELRTPVTVANGAIDLLRRNRSLDASAKRALERIARATEDMGSLIDAFLLLAREYDLEDLHQELQVSDLIEDALSNHATQIERRGLRIGQECRVDPLVSAPITIARIVMRNLVRNAVSHAAGDSVDIACFGEPARLRISNRAEAPSEEERRKGFGLTIVADCCRRLGWDFNVESADGMFVVTITFPADASL